MLNLAHAVDETVYRARYLEADLGQCRFALLVLAAPMVPSMFFDYALFGWSRTFFEMLAARTAVILYTLWIWRRLARVRSAPELDLQMTIWALVGAAMGLANSLTRPPDYFGHYITDVWLILIFYAALTLPPRVQTLPVLVYAGASLLILFFHKQAPIPIYTGIVVLMMFLSVVCGHLISVRIHRYRRVALAAQIELERQARTDALTGALNRREFLRVADEETGRHARTGRPLALLMLDLDHFKRVNDAHGHAAGDAVLVEFARRVRTALRGYDALARLGGEEFCVLLPDTGPEETRAVAERIRLAVAGGPVEHHGIAIPVTVSIGAAAARAGDARLEDWLERADAALYAAKHGGRNRIELAAP